MDYIKSATAEEDYIERCGAVEELTVTITLYEYRALIREAAQNEAELERLAAENDELRDRAETWSKLLLAKHPELLRNAFEAVQEFVSGAFDDEEADEDETARGE